MDPRTRFVDYTEMMETIADDVQARIRTAIPVRLTEDSDGHTVKIQPLIKAVRRAADGTLSQIDLPVISDAPIHHTGGGGMSLTHPHKSGDEGIFLVSDRGLDAWHQQGGAQPQVDARMHSLSDGFYLSNVRSTPRKLDKVSTTSTQLRSDDGKHLSDWNPTKGTITHSVEGGKHVTTVSKDDGISASVDNGNHTLSLSPQSGIKMKSAMAIAAEATKGLNFKGPLSVDGKISSTKPIGGSVLAGILGGGIGAIVGAVLTVAMLMAAAGPGPGDGIQRASYTLARLVR